MEPRYVNLGAAWWDLRLRLIFDDYPHEPRAGYGEVLPRTDQFGFRSWHVELAWRHDFGETLILVETYYEKTTPSWRARGSSSTASARSPSKTPPCWFSCASRPRS